MVYRAAIAVVRAGGGVVLREVGAGAGRICGGLNVVGGRRVTYFSLCCWWLLVLVLLLVLLVLLVVLLVMLLWTILRRRRPQVDSLLGMKRVGGGEGEQTAVEERMSVVENSRGLKYSQAVVSRL